MAEHNNQQFAEEEEQRKLTREELKQWMRDRSRKRPGITTTIVDGTTWMVSVIHPSYPGGSTLHSDRGGTNAREAAMGYLNDDHEGALLARRDPKMTLICVVDPILAPSRKQWKVHLFSIEYDKEGNVQIKEFS